MLLQIIISILIFAAVGLVLSQVLPEFIDKVAESHQQKFDKTVDQLETMFVRVRRKRFFYLFTLSPFLVGIIVFLYFHNLVFALGGFILGLALPTLVVKNLEARRNQKFHGQLIDSLLMLAGCLKSGLSLLQAFEVVVEEMPPPISQEFNLVLNENKMGVPFEESLERLNKRMYSEELNIMVTSVLVGRETGGDLGKIFERLVYSVRQKNKIQQQVKTLTLQARWQGVIMMALPILFAFAISRLNPEFFDTMLHSEKGRLLLVIAVILQISGILIIRRLSKVEV